MDFKQLRTFVCVAEVGSLTKAASRLNVAQPALGRQIKLLEESLKVELFSRDGRGMVLTTAGAVLRERAETILNLIELARTDVTRFSEGSGRSVTLGLPPSISEFVAGILTERLLGNMPAFRFRIVPAFSARLLEMLRSAEIDLAIMLESPAVMRLDPTPLVKEPMYLVGPPSCDLSMDRPVTIETIASVSSILPGPQHNLRTTLEEEARKAGVSLTIVAEADSSHMRKDLARRGLGYTLLPMSMMANEYKAGLLRCAPIERPRIARDLFLVRAADFDGSGTAGLFAEALKEQITLMVRGGDWPGLLLLDEGLSQ